MTPAKPVCVVTGSATGIGAACARRFAREGWNVALNHFDEATRAAAVKVAEDCERMGGGVMLEHLDVGSNDSCTGFSDAVVRRWGRIDALVNCAGTTRFISHSDLSALDADEFHRTYDVNVVGMYQMTRACTAALRSAAGGGAVVNLSSIAGAMGTGSSMAYAASKGAVNTLTRSLARVLAADGVRVNAIAPGMVANGLSTRLMSAEDNERWIGQMQKAAALQRVSQPEEIADLAWFMVAQAPAMTGQVVAMDNGLGL